MDRINSIGLKYPIGEIYQLHGYSEDEILCLIVKKVNTLIEHYNYVDKKIENEKVNNKTKFDYLLNEGLTEKVAREITKRYNDGTLSTLINEIVLNDINQQIKEIKDRLNALENQE